ncbi:hypothetical protein [Geotalea sp. SG265]|uniref:hypothetical protein n=1 Tax=Geotalea sp. SG265 TaxID=2922867 RepID=UPI001FB006CD|nr:hypothetical protein [Geotalea sp. SG265]
MKYILHSITILILIALTVGVWQLAEKKSTNTGYSTPDVDLERASQITASFNRALLN